MNKRSITDDEVSLIKAMLADGMKNKDIQFYFNRPDRPVNSGRITGIRQGTYGQHISVASSGELNAFKEATANGRAMAAIGPQPSPSDSTMVKALFNRGSDGSWELADGETDAVECKGTFDPKALGGVIKAIAAMANNKGGHLLFGVTNRPHRVVGLPHFDFENYDLANLMNKVRAHVQPTPSFRKGSIELDGDTVGFVVIEPCRSGPVIVYRESDQLNDGTIYFRYPAASTPIKFGDLRDMLADRDRRTLAQFLGVAGRIADVGPANAAVLDVSSGSLDLDGKTVLLDETLIEQINFIKEGHFDETGDRALKLMGEVRSVSKSGGIGSRGVVTDVDLLNNFLGQTLLFAPSEYIRHGLITSHKEWLPIFYFAREAGLDRSALSELIANAPARERRKRLYEWRASSGRSAFAAHVGTPASILLDIERGIRPPVPTAKSARQIGLALQGLRSKPELPLLDLLSLVEEALAVVQAGSPSVPSEIYRGACRIDELFFGFEAAGADVQR